MYAFYSIMIIILFNLLADRDGQKVSTRYESGFVLQHSRNGSMSILLVVYGKRPKCMEDRT